MFLVKENSPYNNMYQGSNKRKVRPNPNNRPVMPRPRGTVAADRNIATEGIYSNPRFMNAATALTGCKGEIQVKSGQKYEGILNCFSSQFDIVMSMVTEINPNNTAAVLSPKEKVAEKMVFTAQNIVQINFINVERDYATKESFATDSSISKKANGKIESRELEPWDDSQLEGDDILTPTGLQDDHGWDPNDMFKTNQDKYGVTSTYDSSLAGYTVPLEKKDTEDYRSKEERALKIASEIENSLGYRQRQELENGDEEDRYSAVVRAPERSLNDSYTNAGQSPRFYPVNKKKSTNKVFQRPSPPQPNHSIIHNSSNANSMQPPMKISIPQRTSSPAHQVPRSNPPPLQQQPLPPHQIRTKPPYCPPHVDPDPPQLPPAKPPYCPPHVDPDPPQLPPPAKPPNEPSPPKPEINTEKKPMAPPSDKDEVSAPKAQSSPPQQPPQPLVEKPKLEKPPNNSHKTNKNEEIAGLKKFSNDFDIESSKPEAASPDSAPARSEMKTAEVEDKMAATVKNSILNPNAKEFSPNARSFTPNSTVSYNRSPQTPTPPSRHPASQSPVIPPAPMHAYNHHVVHSIIPAQPTVFTSMAPAIAGQPQQYLVAGQTPVNVSLAPPYNSLMAATMPQNATRFRKEDRRGNADMKIVHVAAATGQPLLAPATAASIPGKFVQYPAHQGIVAAGGPGGPQPAVVSYHHPPQVYPFMGPRMFNQTMTMVPTSHSVSGVNFEQHGPGSQIYCTTSMHGTGPGQQSLVHGMVSHPTPPTQSQSTTPAGAGVHPSPSPVHHQGSANHSNGVPPQPVVYHPSGQIPPPPGAHMQATAPNHGSNGHQQPTNHASHIHLSHGNAGMAHGNQHPVTFHTTPGTAPQHMVLLQQGTAGSQSVIHTNSGRSLQASHMHGPSAPGPGVPSNAVIPHHGNTIPVLQTQASQQLHYLPQQHSQPATGYQHNQ